ncbi:MAG: PilZ domain-containing protein [Acidobacteria bacterium]|nr:PilZ domain-containing protein [Acidobacteriota bacterium]
MSAIGVLKAVERVAHEQSVLRAQCLVNGMNRDCRVTNLNESGLFVESFVPAITDSRINLSFHLPNGHQVLTSGIVTRHQFKSGFHVDFVNLSLKDREQIRNFIR